MTRLLFITLLVTLSPGARGDQQAPSQHSPAFNEYKEVPEAEDSAGKEERQTSSVTLRWPANQMSATYIVKISRDIDEVDLLYTINTINSVIETPELPPGAYYYSVTGMQGERRVFTFPAQPFVVGKPVSLTARKERLPAPSIIGPKHMDLYPTYGYVRAAWQSVDGARGYRFRLWNEDKVKENQRWKRYTPPRWITEVKQPWIEIHDAPYTSFMYLESGTYRWDVAAVDKDGGYIGETALGYFKTSRQWFLKPMEIYLRLDFGYAPNESYSSNSTNTGYSFATMSPSYRLIADGDLWFARQWGVNLDGGFDTLKVSAPNGFGNPATTVMYINASASALFRTYLSTVPWGWTLTLAAGLGMREFPQVDYVLPSIDTSRPKAIGAKLGFRLEKRFDSPFELHFLVNTLLHAYTIDSPSSASATGTPDDSDAQVKLLYNFNRHFAASVGLGAEYHRILYTPLPFESRSSTTFAGVNGTVGIQFNFYPPPDNSSYYPDKPGAYYPSERPTGFYKSEEKSPDYNNDESPWQRWRP